jgi:hypothetical protein
MNRKRKKATSSRQRHRPLRRSSAGKTRRSRSRSGADAQVRNPLAPETESKGGTSRPSRSSAHRGSEETGAGELQRQQTQLNESIEDDRDKGVLDSVDQSVTEEDDDNLL